MYELIKTGGWVMIPIIMASVLVVAIVSERYWMLRTRRVIPPRLVAKIWQWYKQGELTGTKVEELRKGSPLGRMLATGLFNMHHSREIMKDSIEETGRHEVHELERYLNTLGSIATVTPLLGLLGTVIGMIKVFNAITDQGIGDPAVLSSGISEALITTASGLAVAIPALIFYRYLRGRVDELVIQMEQEAIKMVEIMHGQRETTPDEERAPTQQAAAPQGKKSRKQARNKA